jgi:RNA polymerase sigma factor (sigma-70 family)
MKGRTPRAALRDAAARNVLIESGDHYRLVWRVIRLLFGACAETHAAVRHAGDLCDVFQAGVGGLLRAAELYDPAQGAFSTYAVHWIRRHIRYALRSGGLVAVPRTARARPGVSQLRQERGLELPEGRAGAQEETDRADEREAGRRLLQSVLATLPARDARVLRRHYMDGLSMEEVAAELGLSRQRVCQLARRALQKARQAAARATAVPPGRLSG